MRTVTRRSLSFVFAIVLAFSMMVLPALANDYGFDQDIHIHVSGDTEGIVGEWMEIWFELSSAGAPGRQFVGLVDGELPAGLEFYSGQNGFLSGVPTEPGVFTIVVGGMHENIGSAYTMVTLIVAENGNLYIHVDGCPEGVVGEYMQINFWISSAGAPGRQFVGLVDGELPAGLEFYSGQNGFLSGVPTESGVFTIVVGGTHENIGSAYTMITLIITD